MKITIVLCLILLSVYSYSQEVVTGPFFIRDGITYHQDTNELVTGIVKKFYKNGQLLIKEHYKDGERDGPKEIFYDNGQLMEKINFIDGRPDGPSESFYDNGQLSNRGNYKDGKQDGFHEYFDKRGTLTRTMTFRNVVPVESNWNP